MIIDSSFLVSFYVKKDANHEKAVKLMKENEHFLLIPDWVVAETATVLLYKQNIGVSKLFLDAVQNTKTIKVINTSPSDFAGILETFIAQKKQLSFVDASVVYYGARLKLNALTFDNNISAEIKKSFFSQIRD